MPEWSYYGTDRRERFEGRLKPEELKDILDRYRKVFGNGFGVTELLTLMDIEAKAMIAEAINDAPEFLIDQLGKARNSHEFPSGVKALDSIADALEMIANN